MGPHKVVVYDNRIAVDDDYAVQPLNIDNFISDFKDFEIKKEPLKNPLGEGRIDTVITLTKQADTLYIYKTPSKQFLYAMRVNSKRIQLDRKIRFGMSKEEFYKAFKQLDTVANKKDFVTIWSLESSIDFEFKADTLSKITWDFGSIEQKILPGQKNAWQLWGISMPNGTFSNHDYVTTNEFASYEQMIEVDTGGAFKKAFPDKDIMVMLGEMNKTRERVKQEIWELVLTLNQ